MKGAKIRNLGRKSKSLKIFITFVDMVTKAKNGDLHKAKDAKRDEFYTRLSDIERELKQADIVVTNPPFSLFREYVAQLIKYDKKFIIIGHQNAITYKEIYSR